MLEKTYLKTKKKKIRKLAKNAPRRGPGRIRRMVSYAEAKQVVRDECISSVGEYEKWWLINTPARMPKSPPMAYKKDWTTWSAFLGVANKFPGKRIKWATYEEAKKFAREHNIKKQTDWFEFIKIPGNRPEHIPAHPDITYRSKNPDKPSEWMGWKQFLEIKTEDKIEIVKRLENYVIIFKPNNIKNNIYYFRHTTRSEQTIIDACDELLKDSTIYGVYLTGSYNYTEYLRTHYLQSSQDSYIINNINDLYFNFDLNMFNKTRQISEIFNQR